ncbi:hypothetical protein [Streptomyces sp. NPDC060027]|uniref:hypothetical protein n=1 Tax=Streptomyces sp. NPDC060027 TaxID=3347040 RepID=UPI0036A58C8B
MEERRDQPPDAVTRPPVIVSGARLSPLQQAWSRYVAHTTRCDHCRDVDRGRCETSERLYVEYQAHDEAAYRGVAGS